MDPALIAFLVQQLGPLVVPILSAVTTWLTGWILGKASPGVVPILNPVLPVVSAASGMGIGYFAGLSPLTGAVMGLAGTGLHQLIHQPVKAAKNAKQG